jgi:hypothetical protein
MKSLFRLSLGLVVLTVLAVAGCMDSSSPSGSPRDVDTPTVSDEAKKALFDKNIYFETQGGRRRVIISATVCRRAGLLELFMCRTQSKEHESILVADVNPVKVHEALIAAKAEAGSTVQFEPKLQAPTGTRIRVTVQYEKDGRRISAPAQSWVRDVKTEKELSTDWVFAGGRFLEDPLDAKRPKTYAANIQSEGTLICLANFESAVLDVPFPAAKGWANHEFEPITERIPPLDTKVSVILEPMPK